MLWVCFISKHFNSWQAHLWNQFIVVGQMCPAVQTAIGAVTLVWQVCLKSLHHFCRTGQTSNRLAGNFEVEEGAKQANEWTTRFAGLRVSAEPQLINLRSNALKAKPECDEVGLQVRVCLNTAELSAYTEANGWPIPWSLKRCLNQSAER